MNIRTGRTTTRYLQLRPKYSIDWHVSCQGDSPWLRRGKEGVRPRSAQQGLTREGDTALASKLIALKRTGKIDYTINISPALRPRNSANTGTSSKASDSVPIIARGGLWGRRARFRWPYVLQKEQKIEVPNERPSGKTKKTNRSAQLPGHEKSKPAFHEDI